MSALSYQIPHEWFTPDAWEQQILPLCQSMNDEGGCVAVLLQIDPKERNHSLASAHAFNPKERTAIRLAVTRCRKRRDAAQHDAPVQSNTKADSCPSKP